MQRRNDTRAGYLRYEYAPRPSIGVAGLKGFRPIGDAEVGIFASAAVLRNFRMWFIAMTVYSKQGETGWNYRRDRFSAWPKPRTQPAAIHLV